MNKPLRFSIDDYGDEISDDDIVYEPLDDVTWVDEEDVPAIEVSEEEASSATVEAEPVATELPHAPAAIDIEPEQPAQRPEPAPAPLGAPPCLFRVVSPLPDDLHDAIADARGEHALDGAPPTALEWIAPFRCEQIAALEDVLRVWADERLPLHVTLSEVTAEVIGARRYVAGWALAPAGRVTAAHQALKRAVADLIEPCADAPDPFEPRVVAADRVPAPVFPRLIADMQRSFEPQGWTIDTVALEEADPADRTSRWTRHLTLP